MSSKRTRKSLPTKQLEKKMESINDLDDDCLLHIVKHTSFTDRLTLELVSKRWRSLSQRSWSDFKVLDFQNYQTKLASLNKIEKVKPVLKRMMQRGGKFLVTIKFDEYISRKLDREILSDIAQYCPNIGYLDAYYLNNVSVDNLKALAKKCTKLTSFALACRLTVCQFELCQLFQKNKSLKNLQISILDDWIYTDTIGRVLQKLNKEIVERISITNEEKALEGHCLTDVRIRDFCNLKFLELHGFYDMNHDVLQDFGSRCKSLETLVLAHSSVDANSNSMYEIGKLKNLTLLDVSWNDSVDDELLTLIGANCQLLVILKISGCSPVTDTGMKNIITLPNLKELTMAYLHSVTDQGFEQSNMPDLLYLDCNSCGQIGDAALTRVVETSEKLYFINLQECENVTDTFLNVFYDTSKKRKIDCILIQ